MSGNDNKNVYSAGSTEERLDEKVNLYELANFIVRDTKIATDNRTYLMYRWNGKCWVDDAESYIHERLVDVEGDAYKPYHLTTLMQMVQALTFRNVFEEPPPNLICFENGVFDVDNITLLPHSPEMFFRNVIRADYNPNAKAKTFLKWLEEVLPNEEARKCIQELFGYCLYRGYPFHHIFFLVGSGRNGKGTLIRTLVALLGKENCASVPLERLPERFQATNLIGKLANVASEPKTSALATETLRALTGEDLITAEFKGRQKITQFFNYAKLIVMANKLPPVYDSSLAWWERVIVIEFPVTIPEAKRTPNIEEQWLSNPEERSGIINWALEGLKRLLENKRFTRNETMKNAIEEYKRWSQPAQYFLDKYCIYGSNFWITKKDLYEAYKIICEEEDLPVVNEETFSREIRKKPRVSSTQKRIQGRKERAWIGLTLKEEALQVSQVEQVEQVLLYPGKIQNENKKFLESIETPVPLDPVVPPPSVSELLRVFRDKFPRDFNDVEFFHFFVDEHGLTVEEAEKLLDKLVGDGDVFSSYEGVWRWA